MQTCVVCLLAVCFGTALGLGTVILNGDIYIEFIDAMYTDAACSVAETESIQNLQAVKWAINKLNEGQFIPNAKIGLRVSETCSSVEKSKQIALQLTSEISKNDTTDVVGVVGPGSSSEMEAISRLLSPMPDQYRLLQLGYSATSASLRDRDIYRNLFRTIPPDDIQVEVMRGLLQKLNWTFMAVIYDNDTYGRGGLEGLQSAITGMDICFPETIAIDSSDYNNHADIENLIKTRVYKIGASSTDPPISGILVFGSYRLAQVVLTVTDNIRLENENISTPVFLFSEAAIYIEGQFMNMSRGAFILSAPKKSIQDFQTYLYSGFTNKSELYARGKYFKHLYEALFNCTLADDIVSNTCPIPDLISVQDRLQPSAYNQYAIQAALVMAYATKEVLKTTCGLPLNICNNFLKTSVTKRNKFMDILVGKTINFDKDFGALRITEFQDPDLMLQFGNTAEVITDQTNFPVYEVYNIQVCNQATGRTCLMEVAEYKSNEVHVSTDNIRDYNPDGTPLHWPDIRKPQCPDGFVSAICLEERIDDTRLYIDGDIYIVGIVPVHNIGDTPLKCGNIKHGGVEIVEAIRFAVEQEQKRLSAKVGLIVIDSCNDPQIIQEKILSLQRRGVIINGVSKPLENKILGYVGGWSSDVSITVAHLTSRLHTVQISYASTSTELSRRLTFPYFLRIPSPDNGQARALLQIVKQLGGNFIQIVYSETKYGEGGRDLVKSQAGQVDFNICVGNEIPVNIFTKGADIVNSLRSMPNAKFVIVFVGSFDLEDILSQLNDNLKPNEFRLIASEEWGKRQYVRDYHNIRGTITLSSQLSVVGTTYSDYLQSLKPDGTDLDPWVRPYMEAYFDCYYEWSYNKSSEKQCLGTEVIGNTGYEIEAWAPFAQRAVQVMMMAAEVVIQDNCLNTLTLCENFNITQFIVEIKKQKLPGSNNPSNTLVFDDNGDGTAGYWIFAVDDTYNYAYIGYSGNGDDFRFSLTSYNNIRSVSTLSSTCGNQPVCQKCFPVPPDISDPASSLPGGAIAVIIILGIICCSLAAVLMFICNRHGCCIRIENGRPKFSNTYLTPIYRAQRQAHGPIDGSEKRELPRVPAEEYDRISYVREHYRVREGDGGSSVHGSSGGTASSQGAGSMMGIQNKAFDGGSLERQNSNASGSGGGSGGAGYLNPGPEAHRFIKPTTISEHGTTQQQEQQQDQKPVVFQPDGSYITAHVGSDSQTFVDSVGNTGNNPGQRTSDSSLGYLRSVQNSNV